MRQFGRHSAVEHLTMRRKWVVMLAIAIHLLWGILLLSGEKSVTGVTAIHTTQTLLGSPSTVGWAYLLASFCSLAGIILEGRIRLMFELSLMLPQQFLLMLSAFGALYAMRLSAFADGVVRPRSFLIADQGPAVLIAVFHTLALWEVFGRNLWIHLVKKWQGLLLRQRLR